MGAIKGYRDLSSDEIALMNEVKTLAEQVGDLIEKLQGHPDTDKRWLAIGRTAIENGFMAVNRAVFQPARAKLPGDAP